MPKSIVVCCDGTWNRPRKNDREGLSEATNVEKLRWSLAAQDGFGRPQIAEYFEGVGNSPGQRVLGGLFGKGLADKVKEAYGYIVEKFREGDDIYLFGFSRGAFTARSVAGMIRNVGVLKSNHADQLDAAFDIYRSTGDAEHPNGEVAAQFRERNSFQPRIRFIGVWDTVGRLGIPLGSSPLALRLSRPWSFHNTDLSGQVRAAFQALAIDERRAAYEPAVWKIDRDADQVAEQVWFSGAHSDVGGGYSSTGLSDLAFQWMAHKAMQCDLRFKEGTVFGNPGVIELDSGTRVEVRADPLGDPLHDESRSGIFRWLKRRDRSLGQTAPDFEAVAWSADERRNVRRKAYPSVPLDSYLALWDRRISPRWDAVDAPNG